MPKQELEEKSNVSVAVQVEVTDDDKPTPQLNQEGDKGGAGPSVVIKPGIEEIGSSFRYRVRNPDDFQEGSFRTGPFKESSPKINAVFGRLKGESKSTLQSLIFPEDEDWTKAKVQSWVDSHKDELKAWGVEAALGFEADADFVDAPEEKDLELAQFHIFQAKAPVPGRVIRKTFSGTTVKTVHGDDFSADIVISSADMDRDHEVVEPDGMTIKDKVLPLVAGHFLGSLQNQIGYMPRKPKRDGDSLITTPTWLVGRGNPQADWAWVLVQEGVAKFSIGFIPIDHQDADLSDEKVLARVRSGKEPLRRHTKWELVEVSQVIVPSNRSAVQRMVEAGILVGDFAEAAQKAAKETEVSDAAQALFDKAIASWKGIRAVQPESAPKPEEDDILKMMETAVKPTIVLAEKAPDGFDLEDIVSKDASWKVGGKRGLTMTEDDTWDAGAARASMGDDMATWKTLHVVYDSSNPDQKGSYKLPFGRVVDGEKKASKSGLQAARQRLSNTDIGDAKEAAARFIDSYLGKQEEAIADPAHKAGQSLTQHIAEQERSSEAWRRVYDLWYAAYDLILLTAKEPQEARAGRLDAILDEFVSLVKPAFLEVVNLEAERLAEARAYGESQRKGPAELLRVVLEAMRAERESRGTITGEDVTQELSELKASLPEQISQALEAALTGAGLKGVDVTAFVKAADVPSIIKTAADAIFTQVRTLIAREKGDVDQFRLEDKR